MGGGGAIFGFYGGHSCYEGDIELTGGVPPLGKTLEKYDLEMLKFMLQSQHYVYCFQRISQNTKANKLT